MNTKGRLASSYVALFSSSATLVCCALPALLVTFGMGATLVSLTSSFPQLIWLSQNKAYIFGFAALILALSWWSQLRSQQLACPTDPNLRDACQQSRGWSRWTLGASTLLYSIGILFAYILPVLMA